ncbi:HET-domain-containing protein, partial [Thozetella sp. PMI_491]
EFDRLAFFWDDLAGSAANGCGSCEVLRGVLETIFSGHKMVEYCYAISARFIVTRWEIKSGSNSSRGKSLSKMTEIPLFQPKSSSELLECMPVSNFLSGNTASDVSMGRLSRWLELCEASHKTCAFTSPHPLPTRLVDTTEIFRAGNCGVRIVETSPGQTGAYLCLSHCWGSDPIQCCTTDQTLGDALDFLDFTFLPKNFRDAIVITRKLGVRYIWIDSLCIIQGNPEDWKRESAKMADIYRHAKLTIAAVSSPNSTGGCFSLSEPDLCLAVSAVPRGDTRLIGVRMSGQGPASPDAFRDRYPIFFRGWVFQERLLSRRVVFFNSEELSFDCLETRSCECGNALGAPHPMSSAFSHFKRVAGFRQERLLMAVAYPYFFNNPKEEREKLHGTLADEWRKMVTNYKTLNLTHNDDILPALSGCASVIKGLTRGEYVAGMWRRTIEHDLLWTNIRPKTGPTRRNEPWTAPTWSWASLPPGQPVQFSKINSGKGMTITNFLRSSIRDIRCEPVAPDVAPFGKLKSGYLRMSAQLFPCHVRRFCGFMASRTTGRQQNYKIYKRELGTRDECIPPEEGLDLQGAVMTLLSDTPPARTFSFEPFKTCKGSVPCGIARVYLLRMEQRTTQECSKDTFMVLKNIGAEGRGSGFERTGVVYFTNHHRGERKKWFEEIWD